ncbi:hypothetical protein ACS0TY_034975 [Phlomoides rotata]
MQLLFTKLAPAEISNSTFSENLLKPEEESAILDAAKENGIIFHQAFQSPICQEGDVNSYACIDYRGTLEHPATTCTLEEEEGTNCWGAAYCIVEGRKKKRQRWCIWSEENASMTRKLWLTFIKKVILKSPL